MGGEISQNSLESHFFQPLVQVKLPTLPFSKLDGRIVTVVQNNEDLSSSQVSIIKQLKEEKFNNLEATLQDINISISENLEFENESNTPTLLNYDFFYFTEDDSENLTFHAIGTNPEEEKKAIIEERIVGIKDNGENGIEFTGKSKARKAINHAQQNNHNIDIKKSDGKSLEVKQFTFRKLNDNEKAFFNSAMKAHSLFLENQSKLNKIEKEEIGDSFVLTTNYKDSNDTKQVREKRFHDEKKSFYVKAEPNEQFNKHQLHKLQEKFLEIAIIKEAKAEEQDKKKLEKKLADKNFFENNDIFKSVLNQDISTKPNIKASLLIVKIIKKFNFSPQIATCILKTT